LEHEVLILVFRVPQSVQKVKIEKFIKSKGIVEQKNELLKYYAHNVLPIHIWTKYDKEIKE
jgi:hypothetical protein